MNRGSIFTFLLLVVVASAIGAVVIYRFGVRGISDNKLKNTAKNISNLVTGDDGFSFNENTPGYETYKIF